ncbi:NIPSNAP family protein [Amycolatopsis sp. GM8]|uniref:NIPSNAP family protein n=1 Tax=Amycolatopsis sp. GM8 TaxID=2896530 RepID=UPI001F36037B|nr:NIPSNAP family protein [Amycolatopsis sp. GM8]
MFYEIRRYQTRPGRRAEWVRYMEGTVIPFMESQGMSVTASFVDEVALTAGRTIMITTKSLVL